MEEDSMSITDEELAEIGRLWMAAYQDVGTSTLAYRSLVTFPRLIVALKAERAEVERLKKIINQYRSRVVSYRVDYK